MNKNMTNVTKMKIMRNHEKKMTNARITEKDDKHKTLTGINITNGKKQNNNNEDDKFENPWDAN
jgi:hypothetical protein